MIQIQDQRLEKKNDHKTHAASELLSSSRLQLLKILHGVATNVIPRGKNYAVKQLISLFKVGLFCRMFSPTMMFFLKWDLAEQRTFHGNDPFSPFLRSH